jgi:hypothetical protein
MERRVYEDRPEVELLGVGFAAYYNVLGVHRRLARQALERARIGEPQPDGWYPRHILLDVLHDIEQQGDPSTAFQVGKELANFTELPPAVKKFEDVLHASELIYTRYQRNLPVYDFIQLERAEGVWRYVYHTPWPSQAIRGWLWQMARKLEPARRLQIDLIEGTERSFERTFKLGWA